MFWESFNERNGKVIRASGWLRIGDNRDLGMGPGVFVFADDSRWVWYIGSARHVFEGVTSAIRQKDNLNRTTFRVKVLYTGSHSDAQDLARSLIREYDPEYN